MHPRLATLAALAVGVGMLAAAAAVLPAPRAAPDAAPSPERTGEGAPLAATVRFGRDVRPILSDRCYLCHGPDRAHQQAGLRLDSFEAATAPREGGAAIVPGRPDESALVRRITD